MDKIIISDLEVYAYHGVHREEKKQGQMFIVSVEISADLGPAAQSDDLTKTIHYGHVCRDIERVMSLSKYDLIETAADRIIQAIFENYPSAVSVKAKVKKPWAPLGRHLKYVAAELERSRVQMHEPKS